MSTHIHFLGVCEHPRELVSEQKDRVDGMERLPGKNPAVWLDA